ncbi:MAG: hypothetical protein LIO62_07945 [Clostridiales bacterium]|nr:hypothetical protein [Clostridiales bacterium]
MDNTKQRKGKIYCLISAAIVIICYIMQRIISIVATPTRTSVIVQALVFSMAVGIVYLFVVKSNEIFYGILTALLGFKMLPPSIPALENFSIGASVLYYIVTRVSLVIFALAVLKLFRQQEKPAKIKAIPIISLMVITPFFVEIGNALSDYFAAYFDGNMIYSYFVCFATCSCAKIVTLAYGVHCTGENRRLIADCEIVALVTNLVIKICSVILYAVQSYHISKSQYCWIAIYGFFVIMFFILRKKTKTPLKEIKNV